MPEIPWDEKTAPNRVRPKECIGNARDALNRAYGTDRGAAALIFVIESVDWLRRGLEQMVTDESEISRLESLAIALEDDERHGNLTGRAEDAFYRYQEGRDA